jgi:acyl-CoA synthetase (NDP forming)
MAKRDEKLGERERGRIFLAASVGEISVADACRKLGISRQRFYELEERAVRAFLEALEPRAAGRPRKKKDSEPPVVGQVDKLEKENQKLWLYIKALQKLAGIKERGKKSRGSAEGYGGRRQDSDR